MNWKECGRKRPWRILMCHTEIFLNGPRETTKLQWGHFRNPSQERYRLSQPVRYIWRRMIPNGDRQDFVLSIRVLFYNTVLSFSGRGTSTSRRHKCPQCTHRGLKLLLSECHFVNVMGPRMICRSAGSRPACVPVVSLCWVFPERQWNRWFPRYESGNYCHLVLCSLKCFLNDDASFWDCHACLCISPSSLNQFTDFHETWHEHYAIRGPLYIIYIYIFNLIQSVVTTVGKREHMRYERI